MKIQLKRSNVLEGGEAKKPTADQMEYGELAVNYNDGDPAIFIKDSTDAIIRIAGNDAVGIDGYPDLGDGGGTVLDDRYLKLAASAGAQTVQSTDTTTFDGLVEAGAGVKVTGGSVLIESLPPMDVDGNATSAAINDALDSNITNDYRGFRVDLNCASKTVGRNVNHFISANFSNAGNVVGEIAGFRCTASGGNQGVPAKAFVAGYIAGPDVYNFYAAGTAPNFLAGDTYIGGNTTRNTLDLWKSTLTEEQLEQLTAGTLVAPANVSLPGDGSFARQWWYGQQSAEDQALIDSGELEYPSHFQATNFVDTFDLGDNTNINLNADGSSQFKGNMKLTGSSVNVALQPISDVQSGRLYFNNAAGATQASIQSGGTYGSDIIFTNFAVSRTNVRFNGDGNLLIGGSLNQGSPQTPNITLNADGLGEFGGGVKVTGGSAGAVSNGIGSTFNGILNFYANGSEFMRAAADRIVIGTEDPAEKGNIAVYMPLKIETSGGFNGLGSGVSISSYVDTDVTDVTLFNTFGKTGHSVGEFVHFSANKDGTGDVQGGLQVGFKAASTLSTAALNYGFGGYLAADGDKNFNFYAEGSAPNYFAGNIDCDGLINGAFSLRMQSDDPAAYTTTLTTDEEGNEVSNSVYQGTTEDLLAIIKDLRARVTALENA